MGNDSVTYAVCVNQPGYLPEDEPFYTSTLHEAREYAAAIVRSELLGIDSPPVDMTAEELDNILMGAYDLGPDGGSIWLPGDSGYLVDVQPVW